MQIDEVLDMEIILCSFLWRLVKSQLREIIIETLPLTWIPHWIISI